MVRQKRSHEDETEEQEVKASNTNGQLEGLVHLRITRTTGDAGAMMGRVFAFVPDDQLSVIAKVSAQFAKLATDELRANRLAMVPYVPRPVPQPAVQKPEE